MNIKNRTARSLRNATFIIFLGCAFPIFFYLIYYKGIWGFEEASHYFPIQALTSLRQNHYFFGMAPVAGNSENMLPLGLIFGIFQVFISNAMLPFWITSMMAFILSGTLYLASGIWIQNKAFRILFVFGITFSFIFLETVFYLSKVSGVIFFFAMLTLNNSKLSPRMKITSTIGIAIFTLGMCANLAILAVAHCFIFVSALITLQKKEWNWSNIRPLLSHSLIASIVEAPILWLIYIKHGELSGYGSFAKDTSYHFGASRNFLTGEGYWLQFQSYGKIPYFDFMPKEGSFYYAYHFWLMVLVLLVPFGYRLVALFLGNKKLNEIASDSLLPVKAGKVQIFAFVAVGITIFLNYDVNPLALLMRHFLPLRALREPWTKLEVYFYIFLVLWTIKAFEKIYNKSQLSLRSVRPTLGDHKTGLKGKRVKSRQNAIRESRHIKGVKVGLIVTLVLYTCYYAQFPIAVLGANISKPVNHRDFPYIAPGNTLQPILENIKEVGEAWTNSDSLKPMIICNVSGDPAVSAYANGFLPFLVNKLPEFVHLEEGDSIKSISQVFDCGFKGSLLHRTSLQVCAPVFKNPNFFIVEKYCLVPKGRISETSTR